MDACLPEWNTEVEVELPVPSLRKPLGVSDELVELVWQNREEVLLSQTHRKPTFDAPNDETDSWIHCPIDESFEEDFLADLSPQNPLSSPDEAKELSGKFEGVDLLKFGSSDVNNVSFPRSLQPPTFETSDRNTGNLELPVKRHAFNETASGEICKCWDKAMGSSHCGSNQVANHDLDMSRGLRCGIGSRMLSAEVDKNWAWKVASQSESTERRETLEQATTFLEGSPTSFWRTKMHSSDNYKRKWKIEDVGETECGSDATESESAARNKSSPKSGRTRTRRVAEMHNLSERRRRDRINEKLRALQELIPRCNKSGKASILDDAIRYMKSLQLQLQLMRMRSGMAQMMLPVMQHYLSRVGTNTNTGLPMLPVYQNLMPASRLPHVDRSLSVAPTLNQATIGQGLVLNPANYLNQMQNRGSLEQYANYMGFCPMQNTSQERLPPRINLRSVEPRLSNRQ